MKIDFTERFSLQFLSYHTCIILNFLTLLQKKPPSARECNRVPCPAQWKEIGWSSCTKTCGDGGIQRKEYVCEPHHQKEKFFDCGLKPISTRPCDEKLPSCALSTSSLNNIVSSSSCEDASSICGDNVMMRYCSIPSYSALCCKSCKSQITNK